jgi:hypothetical protein
MSCMQIYLGFKVRVGTEEGRNSFFLQISIIQVLTLTAIEELPGVISTMILYKAANVTEQDKGEVNLKTGPTVHD